ncbi:MAG TPA: hypothetical protein VM844_00790 [Miltoncostaeaceae bacterium]|nr:hypothetical protein [Miltoncostaeaceae bacterium]
MLARLDRPRRLRVVGAGRGALHLDLDGFVVTVATRRVPMMANAVAAGAGEAPRAVAWDRARPPAWAPVPPWDAAGVRALGDWLAALLALAAGGAAPEPVHRLLAAGPEAARERALADLGRLGASTGRAVAAGVALAARYLTLGTAQG